MSDQDEMRDKLKEQGERIKQELEHGVYQRTEETIRALFERMPFEQTFTLQEGVTATIKPFFEPKDDRGYWSFGVDVKFDDDSLLEFTVSRTGGEQQLPTRASQCSDADNKNTEPGDS